MTTLDSNNSERPQLPLFASAPRVVISMGGTNIAMAIGINFNLSVDVQPVYAFGSYKAISIEPVFYNLVTGTIQIIRLANGKNRKLTDANSASVDALSPLSSSKGPIDPTSDNTLSRLVASDTDDSTANSVLGVANLHRHLDPSNVLASSLFDLVVKLRVPTSDGVTSSVDSTKTMTNWLKISGCRINARNVNITMGQIVNEPVSFTGLYVNPYSTDGITGMFSTDNAIKDS